MPDPSDKGTETAADVASSDDGQSMESKKTCADCGTSKTPLWRGGPAGPKSLCNACGIRSRKKRRVSGGLNKEPEDMKKLKKNSISRLNSNCNSSSTAKFSNSWKRSLLGLGKEVSLQRPSSSALNASQRQHRRKLGEVEQAAALLMALSYGSVYA